MTRVEGLDWKPVFRKEFVRGHAPMSLPSGEIQEADAWIEAEPEELESFISGLLTAQATAKDSAYEKVVKELGVWRSAYTCCESSPECANNKLKSFCDQMLGDKEWTEKHEHLYNVMAEIELDRDMYKFHNDDIKKQLSSLQSKAKGLEEALEKIWKLESSVSEHGVNASETGRIAKEALKCYREEKV